MMGDCVGLRRWNGVSLVCACAFVGYRSGGLQYNREVPVRYGYI
jgi:hypothetical protein